MPQLCPRSVSSGEASPRARPHSPQLRGGAEQRATRGPSTPSTPSTHRVRCAELPLRFRDLRDLELALPKWRGLGRELLLELRLRVLRRAAQAAYPAPRACRSTHPEAGLTPGVLAPAQQEGCCNAAVATR